MERRSVLAMMAAAPMAKVDPASGFERFVRELAAQDLFSGNVLLARNGRTVLVRSYGMANKQSALPNDADTIFNLASVTKTFTAVAVAQLVQDGKLAFHHQASSYLEWLPPEVTIHHLLTHTSGVGRPALGPGLPGSPEWDTVQEFWEGTLDIIRGTPLRFTPGTRHEYSNDGFFVLGEIVARIARQSYFDYVRSRIFEPAGMTRTGFYTRPQVLARNDIARPYWTQRDGTRIDLTTTPMFLFCGGPDSGAYSTVGDLLAYVRALRSGRLLGRALASLITGGKVPVPGRHFYGYGFADAIVAGHRIHGHSGSGPGRANNLDIFEHHDNVAVVLGNYDTSVEPIVTRARQTLTG